MKLKLTLTDEQLHLLLASRDTTRASAKAIKVDRPALINLLMDYSRLLGVVGMDNVEVPE